VNLEGVKGNSARDFVMVDNVWRSIEGLTQQSTRMITPNRLNDRLKCGVANYTILEMGNPATQVAAVLN
jgi:hypothetical protein